MDSPGVQIQFDPVAPAEVPKSRDVAPGKKRDDQSEGNEANAAAAALTASFAEILQSKRQDLKSGAEEQTKKDHSASGKKIGQKVPGDRESLTKGQPAAADKRAKQPITVAQCRRQRKTRSISGDGREDQPGQTSRQGKQGFGATCGTAEKGSSIVGRRGPAEGDDPEERGHVRPKRNNCTNEGLRRWRASEPP